MTWDGKERRSDDHTSRLASLEVYSKTQQMTIRELKDDVKMIRVLAERIGRDVESVKFGGRLLLASAAVIGGMCGAIISYFK